MNESDLRFSDLLEVFELLEEVFCLVGEVGICEADFGKVGVEEEAILGEF